MTDRPPQQPKIAVLLSIGLGVGLSIVSILHLGIARSARSERVAEQAIELPRENPSVSRDLTANRADLNTTVVESTTKRQPARIALKEAQLAVARSQAQLAQARINLKEFRAKHDRAKISFDLGKIDRQQANTAKAAHKLAQLQHSLAWIGIEKSQAQLIAAKAAIRKLGCKPNSARQM